MERFLKLHTLLHRRSHFLFGPRGTGKSFLVRHTLTDGVDYVDLLRSRTYLDLQHDPGALESYIQHDIVVIDEVQRIPELLNEVHRLIEERGVTFLLTGSSARKLRRAGVNLLAGRAAKMPLFALTWREIASEQTFDLHKYLLYGGLPTAWLSHSDLDARDYLDAYVETYLREEIQAEALVRNIANYSRVLTTAALANAGVINFSKIGSDAQVAPNTVREHFQLLEDTLVGALLPSWSEGTKRQAIQSPKFYFFDIGIVHALAGIRALNRNSDTFGRAFEHFIYSELRSALAYLRCRVPLSFWRTRHGHEVDFVLGDSVAIEVKAAARVTKRDHRGLRAIADENTWEHLLLVSQDEVEKRFDTGVRHLHWEDFLSRLWRGEFF